MADIKTRRVDRTGIKTLDRAAGMMHHVKDAGIKTRVAGMDHKDDESHNENEYAQNRLKRDAVKTAMAYKESTRIVRSIKGSPGNGERLPADSGSGGTGAAIVNRRMEGRRREYSIRRLAGAETDIGGFWRTGARNAATGNGRISGALRRTFKSAGEGTFRSMTTLTAGGTIAMIIIVIMILFSAGLMMTEDGGYVTGTGDGTIVEVARGELGNVGGDKFWKWYGFTSHVDWCACFVSWCGEQCGYIKDGITPKFALVSDGASWFKSRRRWSGRGYKPKPGDFIFFDFGNDGGFDHVGIVESCDGKMVTTIEGNSGNACRRNTYSVGSRVIAGYGIMIQQGGNKAKHIVQKAAQLAYPNQTDESKYHGGKPTAAYKAALERAYPNRSSWGKPSRDGASCDVFVGVVMVDSGVDKNFPRGYRDQAIRLRQRTDLYECVVSTTSRDVKESELKDGDIITWEKSNGTVHICIYAGGKLMQASHDKRYPRTTGLGAHLKIKNRTVIRVYRVREK